jgi:hypothetical protein
MKLLLAFVMFLPRLVLRICGHAVIAVLLLCGLAQLPRSCQLAVLHHLESPGAALAADCEALRDAARAWWRGAVAPPDSDPAASTPAATTAAPAKPAAPAPKTVATPTAPRSAPAAADPEPTPLLLRYREVADRLDRLARRGQRLGGGQ